MQTSHTFDWTRKTWNIIETYFKDKKALVRHQIDSYDDFIDNKLQKIINEFNPVISYSNFNTEFGKYMTEYHIEFGDISISKPVMNDNDGSLKVMYPNDARLRNLTYSSSLVCNVNQRIVKYDDKTGERHVTAIPEIKNVPLGKIPIMLQSKCCVLSEQTNKTRAELGECEYDEGGYFIINGSEKVMVSMERKCENKIFVFPQSKGPTSTYSHIAEITSVDYNTPAYIKQLSVKLTSKEGNFYGRTIRVQMSKIRADIAIFVIYRAFGVISDRDIIESIVYDMDNEMSHKLIEKLKPSLEEAEPIQSKKAALEYISKYIVVPTSSRNNQSPQHKLKYVEDILLNEILPHVGKHPIKKVYFLGLMVRKLLFNFMEYSIPDDRDSFINKRVESPGALLATLFRSNFYKLTKDLKMTIDKDIKNGRSDEIYANISKKIKASQIETNMKYALATGNWGLKNQPNKKGVAQVMNRLSYLSSLSHRRRIIAPLDRNGKQTAPRKLHSTQFSVACCCETPEGAGIGIVKNLALMAYITNDTNPQPIIECMSELGVLPLEEAKPYEISRYVNVFINGDWIGLHKDPNSFVGRLKEMRRSGLINIYTSIAWNIKNGEININTEAGRIGRPLYIVENNDLLLNDAIVADIDSGKITWKNLLADIDTPAGTPKQYYGCIEHIDTQEADTIMIAMTYDDLKKNNPKNESFYRYTHCEIHPSMMLGVLASNIPFPDHNQSPRNLYQTAMGKQAMGIYATNFNRRVDTVGHILHYPQKPLVNTKPSIFLNSNKLPSGQNAIVAIMCHTGYNQEDSLIMNADSVARGLFNSSSYKTYKDQEKKNQSTLEEEKFCKPVKFNPNGTIKTRSMKQGSYEKLNNDGLIKVGSKVESNDVIIGKVLPLKSGPDEPKFKDVSVGLKDGVSGVVDYVLSYKNDGYREAKVRIRSERIPEIGDKFASRHGQKGTNGMLYRQEDMPYTKDGIVPDIIMNPLAIPSRMTIGQLIECLLGKACAIEGYEADATPFTSLDVEEIANILKSKGFEKYGTEIMYNGRTGEQLVAKIFIGPTFYYRLKHLVSDKWHSRATGPYQLLTKQPAEGRSRDGGLRMGEMERDSLIGHGVSYFLKERLFESSDKYVFYVCKKCGMIPIVNPTNNIYKCTYCDNVTNFAKVFVPYATKLMLQELISMGISPRMLTE